MRQTRCVNFEFKDLSRNVSQREAKDSYQVPLNIFVI